MLACHFEYAIFFLRYVEVTKSLPDMWYYNLKLCIIVFTCNMGIVQFFYYSAPIFVSFLICSAPHLRLAISNCYLEFDVCWFWKLSAITPSFCHQGLWGMITYSYFKFLYDARQLLKMQACRSFLDVYSGLKWFNDAGNCGLPCWQAFGFEVLQTW